MVLRRPAPSHFMNGLCISCTYILVGAKSRLTHTCYAHVKSDVRLFTHVNLGPAGLQRLLPALLLVWGLFPLHRLM